MKTLYILRHAKSDWSEPGQDDIERAIREKGIKRTELIIKYMQSKSMKPELIVSSHALRAIQTAKLVANGLNYPKNSIVINPKIYYWNEDQIGNLFFELNDAVSSMLLVGHNPAFTGLGNKFLTEKISYLPTSGLVCVHFDIESWADLDSTKVVDSHAVFPKMLASG